MCFEEIGLRAQKLLNVIGSIVNINEGIPIWLLNSKENVQSEQDIDRCCILVCIENFLNIIRKAYPMCLFREGSNANLHK